jgi:5'-3' exonuclease
MNLIIDISNIFYRSLFTVNLGYNKFGCTFSDDNDVQRLIRKVATDVSYIIRQTNASRIIFAFDSKS